MDTQPNKKEKKHAMQWTFRLNKKVHPKVIEFCNKQSKITDSLIYLIEKEIQANGVRNLQEHIPSVRHIITDDIEGSTNKQNGITMPIQEVQQNSVHKEAVSIQMEEVREETETIENIELKEEAEPIQQKKEIASNIPQDYED